MKKNVPRVIARESFLPEVRRNSPTTAKESRRRQRTRGGKTVSSPGRPSPRPMAKPATPPSSLRAVNASRNCVQKLRFKALAALVDTGSELDGAPRTVEGTFQGADRAVQRRLIDRPLGTRYFLPDGPEPVEEVPLVLLPHVDGTAPPGA